MVRCVVIGHIAPTTGKSCVLIAWHYPEIFGRSCMVEVIDRRKPLLRP
ncbi:hypothetical protein Pan97_34830 [Bremerella volcania]|uniref:Uncharacterized protein n=1 Tax=Bremerella volcania TaxID=2527984 RepID=A0A518CB64_9BACT|nr:hypothetical protein Pan97_34830 [Bremerella volcania]